MDEFLLFSTVAKNHWVEWSGCLWNLSLFFCIVILYQNLHLYLYFYFLSHIFLAEIQKASILLILLFGVTFIKIQTWLNNDELCVCCWLLIGNYTYLCESECLNYWTILLNRRGDALTVQGNAVKGVIISKFENVGGRWVKFWNSLPQIICSLSSQVILLPPENMEVHDKETNYRIYMGLLCDILCNLTPFVPKKVPSCG